MKRQAREATESQKNVRDANELFDALTGKYAVKVNATFNFKSY